MKTTGIVRRFDDLGRIVIPRELRKQLFGTTEESEGMPMEIFMDNDTIVLRKYEENKADDVCEWKQDNMCEKVYRVCGGCFTSAYQKDFKFCPYCGKKDKGGGVMERLTKRIFVPKEERDLVVFTQGEYIDTIPAEMTHEDIRKALRKLAEYEDLEEQGLLLRLPCKVGDTIYRVNAGAKEPVIKMRVLQVHYKQLHKDRIIIRIDAINDNDMGESCYLLEDFGKTVFLTQAEAEQKLKEMESD